MIPTHSGRFFFIYSALLAVRELVGLLTNGDLEAILLLLRLFLGQTHHQHAMAIIGLDGTHVDTFQIEGPLHMAATALVAYIAFLGFLLLLIDVSTDRSARRR